MGGITDVWHVTAESVLPGGNGAVAVAFDGDENVIVTGKMGRGGNGEDFYTAKYSAADGGLIWSSIYDGPQHDGDSPYSISIDSENNVFVTGSSSGEGSIVDCVVIKYNATDGSAIWTNRLDRHYSTYGNSIKTDSNGDVFVVGFQQSGPNNTDILTLKLSGATGEIIWQRTYDGPTNSFSLDHGYCALVDEDDNIIVVGSSIGSGIRRDFLVTKYNGTNGSVVWQTRHNVNGSQYAIPVDGFISANGNVFVTGEIVFDGQGTICTVCLNGANGAIVWSNAELLASGKSATASDITVNSEGIATVAGTVFEDVSSRITTISYSESGSIQWRFEDTDEAHSNGGGVSVVNSSENSTIVLGHVRDLDNESAQKICLIKHSLNDPEPEFTYNYESESSTSFWGTALAFSPNQRLAVSGFSWSTNGAESDITTSVFSLARNPIVFIPGIAGSVLEGGAPYRELWPTILPANIIELALAGGTDNKKAVALVMQAYGKDFYNKFVDHFTPVDGTKYILFDLSREPDRLTSTYMLDQATLYPQLPKPTFFPFPYDWRKSSAAHTSTLRQYIMRIKALHGGSKVDIVTHSMGGLLMRRYFLDYPGDASADVRKVVSVAAPYWGAPKAVYRMLTGDFYDDAGAGFPDLINRKYTKVTFATLPAVHELLPSSDYFAGGGSSVLGENGFDLNGDGLGYNLFTGLSYQPVLDELVRLWEPWIPLPSVNNTGFHSGQQGNSSLDVTNGIYVPTLHLYGSQPTPKTTICTKSRPRTLLGVNVTLTGTAVFEQEYGNGDGTVPELSAARTSNYRASAAALTKLTHPDEEKVDHNGIMQNERVWEIISEFLDSGIIPATVVDTSEASARLAIQDSPASVAVGRMKVVILGAGYVRIRDPLGQENTQLSSIAAEKIPGVDIHYGGDDPWVTIEFNADNQLLIEPSSGSESLEIEIIKFDSEGIADTLRRYRFAPNEAVWQLELTSAQISTLRLDENGDGAFDVDEMVTPSHNISGGGAVDIEQPRISLQLSLSGETITVSLTSEDGGQPAPGLFYSLNGGVVQPYTVPLLFSLDDRSQIRAFAEDAAGNTSGLIETAIQPDLSLGADSGGTVMLTWPMADAYVLEESTSLEEGSWTPSESPITREGFEDSAMISAESVTRKFFRLRSRAVTK